MLINKNNYEEFILDYMENNLLEETAQQFEVFLSQNPDIEEEIMNFENVVLPSENIIFHDKHLLKKTNISEQFNGNYLEELCIADIEKDITDDQKNDLQNIFTKYPEKIAVYNDFQKTKIEPDLNIVYNEKKNLKKNIVFLRRNFLYTATSIAASIMLILTIIGVNNRNQTLESSLYTEKEKYFEKHRTAYIKPAEKQELKQENNVNFSNNNINNIVVRKEVNTVLENTKTHEIFITPKRGNSAPRIVYNNDIKISKQLTTKATKLEENSTLAESQKRYSSTKQNVKNITAWKVTKVAVDNFNTFTENDIKLDGQFNTNGQLKAISFNTKSFGFYTNKIKNLKLKN